MIADNETRAKLDYWEKIRKSCVNSHEFGPCWEELASCYTEMLRELRARAQHDRMLLIETASRLITSEACRGAWTSDEEACTQAVRMARLLIVTVDKPEVP